jgi:hypothetical protein
MQSGRHWISPVRDKRSIIPMTAPNFGAKFIVARSIRRVSHSGIVFADHRLVAAGDYREKSRGRKAPDPMVIPDN